jgi:ferric-dicitrate binding protein FerR (iron transport regulator)
MVAKVVELGAGILIRRQARRWLVRMDGDERLSDAEKKALWEWMSRSATHREELVRLCRFWNQANLLSELLVGGEVEEREPQEGRGRSWSV